jgi:hypothetical protein
MPKGRRDARRSKRDDKWRLRFYGISDDQLAIIDLALERVRAEMNTDFDSVAFEALCHHFLNFAPMPSGADSK